MKNILAYCCQGYAVIAVAAAGFTALWALGVIDLAMPLIGYAWFAVAAVGTVVAIGITTNKREALEIDVAKAQLEAFEESPLTGRPFELYMSALAAWAAVSFGWVLGGMSATGLAVVGYGWLVIAVYGTVVGIGIAMNHRENVTAVSTSSE